MAKAVSRTLPRGVIALGLVSMFMDVSSEMIHSLLPLFMVTTLGLGAFTVGMIEGLAESTALVVKIFSGTLSDYLGKRKGLAVFGYGLGALTKPLFALAPTAGVVLAARLLDRVGKGVRGAPRDALIADITPPDVRGAAFGLRQSLDTVGAFVGPLLVTGLMLLWANDFRAVFWVAVIPGAMAVALLQLGLREPVRPQAERRTNPIRREALKRLGPAYWWVVGLCVAFYSVVFPFRRFANLFFIDAHGASPAQAGDLNSLLPTAAMFATPLFGFLADRVGKRALLLVVGSLLLVPPFLLMAYTGLPLALPVALLGISFSLVPAVLWPSVTYLVDERRLGTAYALMTFLQQVGWAAVALAVGAANDHFGAGRARPAGYTPGMWLFAAVALVGFLCALRLWRAERGAGSHGIEAVRPS